MSRRNDYKINDGDELSQVQMQVLLPNEKFLTAVNHEANSDIDLCKQIQIAQMNNGPSDDIVRRYELTRINDMWYYGNELIYVPAIMTLNILRLCHDTVLIGHPGMRKTFCILSQTYWWPSMRKDCNSYVKSCTICARAKPTHRKPAGLLQPLSIPPRPWHSLSMDFITNLPLVDGKDCILVVVDRFTKMSHFIPCTMTINSMDLANIFIQNIVRLHGIPDNIVTDRGTLFTSQFWGHLCKILNITRNLSSAYHPQTDGQTERVNQSLELYLRLYSDYAQTNWIRNLPLAELAYNSNPHDSIGMSPFAANYGYEPSMDLSTELLPETPPTVQEFKDNLSELWSIVAAELKFTSISSKRFADQKRRNESFKIGDFVYLN